MPADPVADIIARIDGDNIRRNLFHLSQDPLPFRKVNHTRPGASKCTLDEADDFIRGQLESYGYSVEAEAVEVQALACDTSKPKAHQYSPPAEEDPWFTAYNLYAEKRGSESPDETILFLAHKDSQSWVDSPGAYDNCAGTVAVLEMARVLAGCHTRRSIRFLFCNEEHGPWTSVTAAVRAKERGDDLVAIFNIDSLGGKSDDDMRAGRKTSATLYTEPEGERFADLMGTVNDHYGIGLQHQKVLRDRPGDDDGSFINAGFPMAIASIGSIPYADPNYHLESDTPDLVDIENVVMATRASLAAGLWVDQDRG
ncbi:M28 family peptidase [Candidatus Poribacteria bacterium]|jgi:acetylornithine deacetylase/succinyl-diaminopimelate desuccinylase-like protein|nr:M28 family peptidase [Candidatus Poribacteria bacterium]MBT5710488.1 M28 family peptidase [Candidatus Poribacteria bacterium]MBT7098920.1 M28 family peptidase [Candidatus Poribacteria bacterium]MBT7805323.1 M28 family peptidase [Candidatus Poribacteria bacterium]